MRDGLTIVAALGDAVQYGVRRTLLFLAIAACKHDEAPPPPSPPSPPPPASPSPSGAAAVPIEATTGAAELLAADGAPMNPVSIAEYKKLLAGSTAVVVATQFPAGLSPMARAGVNLTAHGKNVSWVFDGDARRGYSLVYDANANGDLRDDARHAFEPRAGVFELTLTLEVPGELADSVLPAPVRLRVREGALFVQEGSIRRGVLALPKGPMTFAVLGERGHYGLDYLMVAFDLDRNGVLELQQLDAKEQIRVFEQAVTLDDRGYAFSVDPEGSTLTLVPLAKPPPPRATLAVGTPAPEIAITTFEGAHVRLSELRGKVVLVDFWATMCHPCVKALPRLAELRAKHHARGFELMAIAMPSDDVRTVLGEHAAGLETADEAAQTTYRVDRFPTYFLIGRDGTIACSRCTLDAIEPMLP